MRGDSQDSGYENRTVTLTGSHATTLAETAAHVGKILQRKVSLQIVPEDLFIQFQTGKLPEDTLRGAVTTFHALVRGELSQANPLLTELLGREPTGVEETIEAVLTGKVEYKQTTL